MKPVSCLCVFLAILVTGAPMTAQWLNYPTPGVPRTADGKVNLTAPMPKAPDGKPDLSGVWESGPQYFNDLAKDLKPGELAMLPWAKRPAGRARNAATTGTIL